MVRTKVGKKELEGRVRSRPRKADRQIAVKPASPRGPTRRVLPVQNVIGPRRYAGSTGCVGGRRVNNRLR